METKKRPRKPGHSLKAAMERGDLWMRRALALQAVLRQLGQASVAAQIIAATDKSHLDSLITEGTDELQ